MPSGAGPPGEGFFPRLETLVSKSSEAVLFRPWGEGILDSSPRSSSFAETLIPPVREAHFRLLYSSLYLPLMPLDKARAQAFWPVLDLLSLREGGRTPDHLRLFYLILVKERLFRMML